MGRRLGETRRRARLRNGAKVRKRSAVVAVFTALADAILVSSTSFGAYATRFLNGELTVASSGARDLLPMPALTPKTEIEYSFDGGKHNDAVTLLTNLSIAGINFLSGGCRKVTVPARANLAQRNSQRVLYTKWCGLIRRDGAVDFMMGAETASSLWSSLESTAQASLVATQVDGLERSGLVDPSFCLPPDMLELFENPSLLFPEGLSCVPRVVRYTGGSRREYAALVRRQLKAGKVALMRAPICSAGTFVVGKGDSDRQREVWNGGDISAASCDPPKPRLLADPASLTALEASVDRPLYVSTRDAACYFDQLKLNSTLAPYFVRPQVRVSELCEPLGLSSVDFADHFCIDDLRNFLLDDDGDKLDGAAWLAPVSLTWPMGFSHSSFVAQQLMSASCLAAGFEQSLSKEGILPDGDKPSIAVATDDVNCSVRLSPTELDELSALPLDSLDAVWKSWKIKTKETKCVNLATTGVMLGVELVRGVSLMPKQKRLGSLVRGLTELLIRPRATPRQIDSYLGVLQWTCLLNRPLLSCLGRAYEFADRADTNVPQVVPGDVLSELCLCLSLASCLNIDLTRPWQSFLTCTDGAPSFGFGMAQAGCTPAEVRGIAAHCSRTDHGIIPGGVDLTSSSVEAVGAPLHLPFGYDSFVPMFSIKAQLAADAPTMEATAVSLAMRRITRSVRNHGTRGVLLVDAQALMHALRKGRSSSSAFKVQLQSVAAHCLAADLKMTFGYIPTSCNPGDPPSRGVRRTIKHLRPKAVLPKSWTKQLHNGRTVRRLAVAWGLREKGSFCSSSSGSMTVQP